MSDSRANDAAKAISLIRDAMEKVEGLPQKPEERVAADGIVTVLDDVIRRIEALGGEEGE